MYKLEYNTMDGKVGSIRRLHDNASIPIAEDNSDYQEFVKWNTAQAIPLNMTDKSQAILDEIIATQAKTAKKKQDIETSLKTWKELSDEIKGADDFKKVQSVLEKIAKVLYWTVKDSEL
jgi:hypothetical protein